MGLQGNIVRQAMMKVANVELNDLQNLIVLVGVTTAASKVTTLRRQFATAGYQVTAGKTLYLLAAKLYNANTGGAQNHQMFIGYGDTDVGLDSAADPTTPLYPASTNFAPLSGLIPANPSGHLEAALGFQIPAAKYVFMKTDGFATWTAKASLMLYGYEL